MNTPDAEIERRLRDFTETCRQAGMKITHQRLEIFREVARSGDHPDADTVYRNVRRMLSTVSLDTIYRTLWMLVDLGLISTLGAPQGRTRFDGNTTPHHHFVCTKCGAAYDFYSEEFNRLSAPDAVTELGDIATTHVEFRGVCRDCRNEEPGEEPT